MKSATDQHAPFEVHEPQGRVYRIWLDGRIEGFVPGSIIVNGIAPSFDYLAALLIQAVRHGRAVTDQELADALAGGPRADSSAE